MAGSNPVVQGVVKLYQKIPTSLNPVKTRTPTTRIGQVGKALNPLNPVNIIQALPVGKTNKGETIRIGDFVYLDPVDLLNISGSSPQGDIDDPYSQWKQLRYKSREDMQNKVQAQLAKEQRYTEPAGPLMTAETYRRAREEKAQRTSGGLNAGGPQQPAFRLPRQEPTGAPNLGAPPPAPNLPPVGYEVTTPAPARTNPAPVLQEYLQKASQYAAPTDVPLSGFYAAQRQLGSELGAEEMMKRIETARPMQGMTPDTFKAWAEKNPDLAYREMLRREELAKRGVQ